MQNYKNRFFSKKYGVTRKEESFYEEIRDFVAESRKCQTLYANCEGSYSRRVANLNDRNTLENFIYCTMYFDGTHGWHNEQDFSKRELVEQITDRMIKLSELFHVEEIHFGVAWVYYFSYEDKTQKATPVFKIYRNKRGNEAVFLDVSLTSYNSWDYYLDASSSKFPNSFLCLPRNGDYSFLSEDGSEVKGLDLEFVRSKKFTMKENKAERFNAVSTAVFKPFSQVAVHPWLIKIGDFSSDVMREIKRFLSVIWRKISDIKCSCYNAVVFGFLFWLMVKQRNLTMVEALKVIGNESLMLLNTASSEDGFSKNEFTHAFLSTVLTTSTSGLSNFYEVKVTLTEVQCNGKLLLELLKNPKNNWLRIMSTFCDLLIDGGQILLAISCVYPLPSILGNVLLLLKVCGRIRNFRKSLLGMSSKGSETDKGQELESIISSKPPNIISNSELSVKQTGSFQSPKCCDETDKDVEVDNMALEKILSNLPLLETISSDKSQHELFQESVLNLHERQREFSSMSDSSLKSTRFLFLGKKDSYGFFFIPYASLPELTTIIGHLIGKNFIFKPEKSTVHNIVLTSGNIAATLFFPQKFSAIGVFSLKAIEEQGQIKLELLESFSTDMNYFNQDYSIASTSTPN